MNISPERKALDLPEILENIFLHLDHQSLLTSAQRVCRYWHELVSQPTLQKHLFFEPDWNCKETSTSELLVENFPLWFPCDSDQPDQSTDTTYVRTIDPCPLEEPSPYEFLPLASPGRNQFFMYENASWRRMLVQQPPIADLVHFNASNHINGMSFEGPTVVEEPLNNSASVKDPDFKPAITSTIPLRMGLFYDALTYGTFEDVGTIMVMWNKGEFSIPPRIGMFEFREDDKKAIERALQVHKMVIVSFGYSACGISIPGWAAGKKFVFDKTFVKIHYGMKEAREQKTALYKEEIEISGRPLRRAVGSLLRPIAPLISRRFKLKRTARLWNLG
ncbi:hypothetical protein N7456_006554 [Penicillium angulare]|uniref:F-box domain-containing protein n=1 Tax=Penicillium angulare TaxID=116970 RepID=A0A9W9KCZ9_9EURO|nr:hypothetical protein N7456_006554 [Penicillium angulare]